MPRKSPKRKSPKRHAPKRKSVKRKSPRRRKSSKNRKQQKGGVAPAVPAFLAIAGAVAPVANKLRCTAFKNSPGCKKKEDEAA